jgi:hypothetical protein
MTNVKIEFEYLHLSLTKLDDDESEANRKNHLNRGRIMFTFLNL